MKKLIYQFRNWIINSFCNKIHFKTIELDTNIKCKYYYNKRKNVIQIEVYEE